MAERIQVLHVDDDPQYLEVVAQFLQREDERIEVTTTARPPEGLELIESGEVDCVVSDYDMPGMNGIEFLETVRSTHEDLPFILFTGKGSEEVAMEAISAGVTDYRQKETGTEQYAVLANRIASAVEAHESQAALEERTRQLETLVSNVPGMIYRGQDDGGRSMDTVEGDVTELTGYDVSELETDAVDWRTDVVHPEDRSRLSRAIRNSLETDEVFDVSYRIVTDDDQVRWMRERGQTVETEESGGVTLEGIVTDVTERKEYQRELERYKDYTDRILDAVDDLFFVHDEDGNLQRWNRSFVEITGYSDEEIGSMHGIDFVREADESKARAAIRQVFEEGSGRLEAPLLTKSGETIPYEYVANRVEHPDGDPRLVGIGRKLIEEE